MKAARRRRPCLIVAFLVMSCAPAAGQEES